MSGISTHVLDTARGRPAAHVPVTLSRVDDAGETPLGSGETDDDGRQHDLFPAGAELEAARYRLTFDTGSYFRSQHVKGFYPQVVIDFEVRDAKEHYHVPLLLSPHGYATYRGS